MHKKDIDNIDNLYIEGVLNSVKNLFSTSSAKGMSTNKKTRQLSSKERVEQRRALRDQEMVEGIFKVEDPGELSADQSQHLRFNPEIFKRYVGHIMWKYNKQKDVRDRHGDRPYNPFRNFDERQPELYNKYKRDINLIAWNGYPPQKPLFVKDEEDDPNAMVRREHGFGPIKT